MKGARIFLYFAASIYFGFALNVPLRAQAGSRGSTAPFASFVGRWHCDGKFARNGKPISANLVFESILGRRFILFRHDDELPFNYHAWSEWGWDANTRQFISTIQDISGGVRLFRSPGWVEGTLTWSGGRSPGLVRSAVCVRALRRPQVSRQLFSEERGFLAGCGFEFL
jgi:hypothetical protein